MFDAGYSTILSERYKLSSYCGPSKETTGFENGLREQQGNSSQRWRDSSKLRLPLCEAETAKRTWGVCWEMLGTPPERKGFKNPSLSHQKGRNTGPKGVGLVSSPIPPNPLAPPTGYCTNHLQTPGQSNIQVQRKPPLFLADFSRFEALPLNVLKECHVCTVAVPTVLTL